MPRIPAGRDVAPEGAQGPALQIQFRRPLGAIATWTASGTVAVIAAARWRGHARTRMPCSARYGTSRTVPGRAVRRRGGKGYGDAGSIPPTPRWRGERLRRLGSSCHRLHRFVRPGGLLASTMAVPASARTASTVASCGGRPQWRASSASTYTRGSAAPARAAATEARAAVTNRAYSARSSASASLASACPATGPGGCSPGRQTPCPGTGPGERVAVSALRWGLADCVRVNKTPPSSRQALCLATPRLGGGACQGHPGSNLSGAPGACLGHPGSRFPGCPGWPGRLPCRAARGMWTQSSCSWCYHFHFLTC
jgi:hypothetical protein